MRIINLKSENTRILKVVEITPEGNMVVLSGKNGQGKTSILDSIFMALTGKSKGSPILDSIFMALTGKFKGSPIRRGETKAEAEVQIDLGEIKIKKVWTEKTTRLEVTNSQGAAFKSPQALLDRLTEKLGFDPLEFNNMKPKEQRTLLLRMVNLDFESENAQRSEIYTQRTFTNHSVSRAESLINKPDDSDLTLPLKLLSMEEGLAKLDELEKGLAAYEEHALELTQKKNQTSHYLAEIDSAKTALKNLERDTNKLLKKKVKEVTELDIRTARGELSEIENTNKRIRCIIEYNEKLDEINKLKKESLGFTAEIKAIDDSKVNQLKEAKFPVEGLLVDDEGVLYNGTPFAEISTGEQVKISTAIAMALNPDLRVIFIRNGSLLDEGNMKDIALMAEDKDYQVWVEKVDESGKVGLVIEDGMIVNQGGSE